MLGIGDLPCSIIDLIDLCPALLKSRVYKDTFANAEDSEF